MDPLLCKFLTKTNAFNIVLTTEHPWDNIQDNLALKMLYNIVSMQYEAIKSLRN